MAGKNRLNRIEAELAKDLQRQAAREAEAEARAALQIVEPIRPELSTLDDAEFAKLSDFCRRWGSLTPAEELECAGIMATISAATSERTPLERLAIDRLGPGGSVARGGLNVGELRDFLAMLDGGPLELPRNVAFENYRRRVAFVPAK